MKPESPYFPMLQSAHEAAYNAYSILSDLVDLCRDSDSVDDDSLSSIEDLLEDADLLQSSLFDLLPEDEEEDDDDVVVVDE